MRTDAAAHSVCAEPPDLSEQRRPRRRRRSSVRIRLQDPEGDHVVDTGDGRSRARTIRRPSREARSLTTVVRATRCDQPRWCSTAGPETSDDRHLAIRRARRGRSAMPDAGSRSGRLPRPTVDLAGRDAVVGQASNSTRRSSGRCRRVHGSCSSPIRSTWRPPAGLRAYRLRHVTVEGRSRTADRPRGDHRIQRHRGRGLLLDPSVRVVGMSTRADHRYVSHPRRRAGRPLHPAG